MARRPRVHPAALLAALVLAGCGSSGPTRQGVIDRGDAICASTLRALRAIPSSSGNLNAYFAQALPVLRTQTAQLQRLPRPSADRALLEQFIAATTHDLATYRALAAAASTGDASGENLALSELRDSPSAGLAQRYGLTQCGSVTGTVGS